MFLIFVRLFFIFNRFAHIEKQFSFSFFHLFLEYYSKTIKKKNKTYAFFLYQTFDITFSFLYCTITRGIRLYNKYYIYIKTKKTIHLHSARLTNIAIFDRYFGNKRKIIVAKSDKIFLDECL